MKRYRQREPQEHAARVALDGRVEEALDAGEADDRVEPRADLAGWHAEHRTVESDVLTSGQLRVEPRPDFQQAAHPPSEGDRALRRCGHTGQDLEQRALPGSVVAHQADRLAPGYVERDISQRPEVLSRAGGTRRPKALESGLDDRDGIGSRLAHLSDPSQDDLDQPFLVEGIGGSDAPLNLDLGMIDGVERVSDEESFAMTGRLLREEGLLVGSSTGTNVVAALRIAQRHDLNGPVVTILCDSWDRYFAQPWMQRLSPGQ